MMKYFLRFGLAAAITWAAPSADAQTQSIWNGSFLDRADQYTARRMNEPTAPEVDPATLPTNALKEAQSEEQESTFHNYSDSSTPYGTSYTASPADGGSRIAADGYVSGNCSDGNCAVGIPCGYGAGCSPWFGGVNGLIMTRDDDFDTYLSYDLAMPSDPVLSTSDADFSYGGGVEANIGRYLNDCWGVQFGYWGFYPDDESATYLNSDTAGGLFSALGYDGLSYDNGMGAQTVRTFYGDPANLPALAHRISRNFEAHNFELNLIRNPYRRSGCVHFELLAGFRYLRLDDGLAFSTAFGSPVFGNDPNNELHHEIDVENHLAGFQIGGRADRYFFGCLGVHLGTKFGIYNNHIDHSQRIYGGNGNAVVTGTTEQYDFQSEDDDVAFLGELFAGASYDISCNWQLTGGYRAIVACGVGQSTSQFPRNREFANVIRSGDIDSSDCLLLHGAYFGVNYNW